MLIPSRPRRPFAAKVASQEAHHGRQHFSEPAMAHGSRTTWPSVPLWNYQKLSFGKWVTTRYICFPSVFPSVQGQKITRCFQLPQASYPTEHGLPSNWWPSISSPGWLKKRWEKRTAELQITGWIRYILWFTHVYDRYSIYHMEFLWFMNVCECLWLI